MKDKYIHLVRQLPPLPVMMELIHLYLLQLNPYFKVVEKYYFDKDLSAWLAVRSSILRGEVEDISRDLQYFPCLLFQLLAVELQFLPPNTAAASILKLENLEASEILSHRYSSLGHELMALIGRQASSFVAIQHDFMRHFWFKSCSRGTMSWYSLGDAIRYD